MSPGLRRTVLFPVWSGGTTVGIVRDGDWRRDVSSCALYFQRRRRDGGRQALRGDWKLYGKRKYYGGFVPVGYEQRRIQCTYADFEKNKTEGGNTVCPIRISGNHIDDGAWYVEYTDEKKYHIFIYSSAGIVVVFGYIGGSE